MLSSSVAVISYELSRAYLVRQRRSSLEQQAYVNARLVRNRLRAPEADVPALLGSLGPRTTSSHLLLSGAQWLGPAAERGSILVPESLRLAVEGGRAAHQLVEVEGEPTFAVGVPIVEFGVLYFAVHGLPQLERTLTILLNSLAVAAVVTTGLGAAGGLWASRRVLRPLADVSQAAGAVAAGDLGVRLEGGRDQDLAQVADAFNAMTSALRQRIDRDARFASAVSHELRTPLSTLVASTEVVGAHRDQLPDHARAALDLLSGEVTHVCRLVEDLLEISRIDAGVADLALDEVRLDELVARCVEPSVARGMALDVDGEVSRTFIRADKRRIERVLGNLVANAERHAGGVERVAVERAGAVARICVEDAGPGVPADERERIFERFVRGRSAARNGQDGGAGLGLSLVTEHVRLHGGRVWVEDRPGGGARFVVELPVIK